MLQFVDPDDYELLRLINRLRTASITDLCEATDVTPNAVRQRLTRLQQLELVGREAIRSGRGRPHHMYVVTEKGARQLVDSYSQLANVLWSVISRFPDEAVRKQLVGAVQAEMANRYRSQVGAGPLKERFRNLQALLSHEGFDIELVDGELPILREHGCPYLDLAGMNSSICEMETGIFSDVLGAPLELKSCCRNGDSCCEFHVQELDRVGG